MGDGQFLIYRYYNITHMCNLWNDYGIVKAHDAHIWNDKANEGVTRSPSRHLLARQARLGRDALDGKAMHVCATCGTKMRRRMIGARNAHMCILWNGYGIVD